MSNQIVESYTMDDLYNPKFLKKGYIQIYTGSGKGKSTASMGLALRALGSGWKVLIMQFVKGGPREKYGEFQPLMQLRKYVPEYKERLKYKNCGLDKVIFKNNVTDEDKYLAQQGFWYIIHNHKEYDMIILDEINIALDLDLIHLEQMLDFLDKKPKRLEVVMTGRLVTPEIREKIFERAQLISDITPIKHYYDIGVGFRKGIEY